MVGYLRLEPKEPRIFDWINTDKDIVFVVFNVTRVLKSIFTELRLVMKLFRDNSNSMVAIITNINIIIEPTS